MICHVRQYYNVIYMATFSHEKAHNARKSNALTYFQEGSSV